MIFEEQPYLSNVYPGKTRRIGIVFEIKNAKKLSIQRIFILFSNNSTSILLKNHQHYKRNLIHLQKQFSHAPGRIKEALKIYFHKPFYSDRHMALCHHRGNRRKAPGKLRKQRVSEMAWLNCFAHSHAPGRIKEALKIYFQHFNTKKR